MLPLLFALLCSSPDPVAGDPVVVDVASATAPDDVVTDAPTDVPIAPASTEPVPTAEVVPVVDDAPSRPDPPRGPRPLVLTTLRQGDVVDDDVAAALTRHLHETFSANPELVVVGHGEPCGDEACARALAPHHGYVVYGGVDQVGPLLVVDLHLFDADRGTAAVRAKLEGPDLGTVKKQIDEAAILMLGGEPSSSLSPWIVVGGVTASVGLLAMGVGATGLGWSLYVQNDAASSTQARADADGIFLPAVVVASVGTALLLAGVVVVGMAIDE